MDMCINSTYVQGRREGVKVENTASEASWVADQMQLLNRAGHGRSGSGALWLALEQAVAGLGGLGGMVHLHAGGITSGLRLIATTGLPPDVTDEWRYLRSDEDFPSARALRVGAPLWTPARPQKAGGLPADCTGVAAVPFQASGESSGVLSVLTGGPHPPTPAHWAFLGAVARWLSERPPGPGPGPEEEPQPVCSPMQQARDAVKVGTWWWDLPTGKVIFDEAMEQILGFAPGSFDGRAETWRALVHPEDLGSVTAQIEQSLRDACEIGIKYRVIRPDGTVRWVESLGKPVASSDGRPTLSVGRLWETNAPHAGLELVGRALRHMTDGFFVVGPDWRVLYVNDEAEQLLGASKEISGRVLWELPAAGAPGFEEVCRRAAADRTPADLEMQLPGGRWYHLRLIPVPDVLTCYVTDITEERRRKEERLAAERRTAERASLIGQLTTALAEALTIEDVVAAVADRVLPLFGATGLVVHALNGDRVEAVKAIGYPSTFVDMLARRDVLKDRLLQDALRDGTPRFIASPEQFRKEYPQSARFALKSGKNAWVFLPLLVSGRPVGTCVISFEHPRVLTGEERNLIIALSGMIAQTLARARLYDAEYARAQQLQRALLPRTLPSLPTVATAARYLPAGAGTLGGDWYDVIPLSADRVALVIGDVMGHGLPEAATMGRLRTAVHTLAGLELPPGELFAHLNDVVSDLGDDFYATCLYALHDPVSGICTLACAGHPPPVVVRPDGSVHLPDIAVNPPLGAATPPFETTEWKLPEGSLLVMYTDGVVESAQRDIERGIAQLAGLLAGGPADAPTGSPAVGGKDEADRLGALCDSLVSALLPHQEHTNDDAALLVTRLHTLPSEDVAAWPLPEGPLAAGLAREYVRQRLADWHLDELVMTTELIASELIGNVVRHAKGPVQMRLLRSRTLTCEVSDGSLTTPRIRRAGETDEGGRGLQLVAALSQRWGTRQTPDGKCIWTEQPLPDHRPPQLLSLRSRGASVA